MSSKIVVSLLTDQQSFQRMQATEARAAATNGRIELEVIFANGSISTQKEQLLQRAALPPGERPSAFVVEALSAEGLEKVAGDVVRAGIGWILLSSLPPYIRYLAEQFPKVPVTAIYEDNAEMGRLQGRQLLALLPSGGRVVYCEGPGGSAPAIDRRRAMQEAINGSRLQVMKTLAGDWTEASMERAVNFWLTIASGEPPDAVVCQNDAMALGARRAILARRPDWSNVLYLGCDGLPDEGARYVKENLLAATVAKPTTAGLGVEVAARALRGGVLTPPTALPVQSIPAIDDLVERGRALRPAR
jgi:ribose transport system substrate-binding protein